MRFLLKSKEQAELISALADLTIAAVLTGYVLTKLVRWLIERRPRAV